MKNFLKLLRFIYPLCAVLFIGSVMTGAYLQDRETSASNSFTAGTWTPPPAQVVINELMINPLGSSENFGEWVELYNKGGSSANLNGWYLYDIDGHALEITSSNVDGGITTIGVGGYLAVNGNGDADFSLNNGSDTISLFNGATLVDSYGYASNTNEDKTWANVPDGTGIWLINRDPTKGATNGS